MNSRILFLIILFSTICLFCNSQTQTRIFYDENNYNKTKEIKSYDNKLFILGQHFSKEDTIQHTSTILCIDTLLNKVWDKHVGNKSTGEWFQYFTIDNIGNIFITGYNEASQTALLLKVNAKGKIVWRKEFNDFVSFNDIQSYNNKSLIVMGKKYMLDAETNKTLLCTSVQKMDYNGNIEWSIPIANQSVNTLLNLSGGKIILSSNAGNYNPYSSFPASKLICLNQTGSIEWEEILNFKKTDKGGKVLDMSVVENKDIYVLCESFNPYLGMMFFHFSIKGEKIGTLPYQKTVSRYSGSSIDNRDFPFLLSRPNIFTLYGEGQQVMVKKDSNDNLYFTLTDTENLYVNFLVLNNTIYMIGDNDNLDNNYSRWIVIKTNK